VIIESVEGSEIEIAIFAFPKSIPVYFQNFPEEGIDLGAGYVFRQEATI